MTPVQLAFAWVRAKEPAFVALVGARNRTQLTSALAALEHPLKHDDLAELDRLVPPGAFAGDRYPTPMMALLDSEK